METRMRELLLGRGRLLHALRRCNNGQGPRLFLLYVLKAQSGLSIQGLICVLGRLSPWFFGR